MKRNILLVSLIAVLLVNSQALAVSIKGRAVSTIADVLRFARGLGNVSNTDTKLELEKSSLLRLHDDGQLDLRYGIGSGDTNLPLGQIRDYSAGYRKRDNGFIAGLARTNFDGKKVLISSSRVQSQKGSFAPFLGDYTASNWFYDIYFTELGRKDRDSSVSQSRFGAWRYPNSDDSGDSAYIRDIKTGILIEGFEGELVVCAAMETKNDNPAYYTSYSNKTVNVRLDFWALFTDSEGDIQYRKLDNLTQTKSGFETVPLNGVINATDDSWEKSYNRPISTIASPYMIVKTATGDFNHDGYENEVAMLTVDKKGINLCVYQIECENDNFTIKTMSDLGRIYSFSYPDYFTKWSYNGWNRMPGAEILTGDFDGDSKTEIGVVFQGDISSSKRDLRYYGGTVGSLFTYLYKWNNNTGNFDSQTNETGGVYASRYYKDPVRNEYSSLNEANVSIRITHKFMPWGGIKAVTSDIDGDGRDEIVFGGYESELREELDVYARVTPYSGYTWHTAIAFYYIQPVLGLIKIDSDGKLKPLSDYVWKGSSIWSKTFERGNASYDDLLNGSNPFKVQEYMLAPVGQNAEVFPFTEREMSIAAGPLFGQSGAVKERDDVALRLYGGSMVLLKSDGSTLQSAGSVSATGTSALIAGDFAGEGVELGNPVRVVNRNDRSYTAVLQGIPYHVDTIAPDGKSVTPEPVNFSYTKGSRAEYSASSSESENNNTKFNMTSSLETIFAMDSDITRNIAGGMASLPSLERTIKFPTNKKPGTLDYITSIKNTAGMVFNFLNKLPDKVETVEEVYDNELEETNVFKSIYSDRFDVVSYVYANQYIWRYPIITNPALAYFGTADKNTKYLTKQDFVTFAIYDDTNSDNFTSDSSYQPTHENGNLFSYPAAVPNIEGYNERQKDLTEITGVQFGIPTSLGFTKIKANEHEETSSTTVTKGYLTKAISLLDSIFDTSLANIPEAKPDSAFTKKTSNQEKFVLTLPNADGARLLGSYRIQTQAYIAEDGALTCGFAVNQFDQYASLFNSGSLYRQLPDPSFVLPRKFVLINSTPLIPEFGANTERETAMEMRGVRFYAVDFNVYTTNRLLEGVKYRVEIPLYNASFQSASNVKVNLYWVNDRTEASLANKHLIGTTSVNMTGWSDTGDNKAWAMFEFTPSDMAEYARHYQLYAVIDPDDLMQEVHEKRDLAKDSGGNNEGYFEFSVEGVEASNTLQGGLNVNDDDNIDLPDITYSGYASWEEFYDAKIANSKGPVSLDVVFKNNSRHTLSNIEVRVIYIDENSSWNRAVLGNSFTLFPLESYKISAVIDDDFADSMRRVGRENTFCNYTKFWLKDLLGGTVGDSLNLVELSADHDPELEVISGDIADSDDITYCKTVITETFALSHDTPVFWRINGVSEFVDTSSSDDVRTFAVPHALSEEFNVSWKPEDSKKVREITLTISTIPDVTPVGNYAFRIEVSEDGDNWQEKEFLTLDAGSGSSLPDNVFASSSSGGCDSGVSFCALVLAVVFMTIRKR